MRVLVVDDEPEVAAVLMEIIEALGHEVVGASSAKGALNLLQQQPMDAMLTDRRMPRMGGEELARQVKVRYPYMRTVMVTGDVLADAERKLIFEAAGVFDILSKPVTILEIQRVLNRLMGDSTQAKPAR